MEKQPSAWILTSLAQQPGTKNSVPGSSAFRGILKTAGENLRELRRTLLQNSLLPGVNA
jgi:hypothetical protein